MADAHDNPEVHHEGSDVNVRAVLAFGLALIVAGLLIHVAVWLLFMLFSARETARVVLDYPLAAPQQLRVPPEPRLQTNPREDLRVLRAHEDEILNSYAWVDRTGGIVRIPIDEAMKLTLQRGLPVREIAGDTKK